jgi:hypothetical protein
MSNGQIIWESFEGSELRNEGTLTNLRPFAPRKKFASCTQSYQKVKETAFEVFGRSGGVARSNRALCELRGLTSELSQETEGA